jgi:HD-GYP domain-containing protein (c-di-GMP phosphodiesterase class II)
VEFPEIKTFEDYVYLHSVNVTVIGALIGWNLGFNDSMLEDFAIGALLHDIGKIEVPSGILKKPGPLSEDEFEIMKRHTRDGFNLLQKSAFINPRSFTISLQHHEAYDGSGYPSGKHGEEIHIFSRMVEVVDIFDALTSDRPYKKRWSFYKTISYMGKVIRKKLDPKIYEIFSKLVPPYPVGSTVKLSTNETGIIFTNHPGNFEMPRIRIIRDAKGEVLPRESIYELNLVEHPEIKIVSVVEDE